MSEASELLKSLSDVEYESYSAASPVNDVIEIDANGRFINIPRTEVLLGVETDKDVERKYFRCPRIVGDNIDLTKLQLRVNYQNAEQEKDAHIVQDVTVDGQYINFSWKLSDKVLAAQGTVIFTIQAVSSEQDGTLKNRWNTTLASGTVLETLIVELDYYEEEQARELLTELLQMMDNKSAESIQKIQNETNTQLGRINTTGTQQVQAVADEGVRVLETIPADYQETYKMADEGVRTKVDAITDGVESQDTIVLTNAANDPLRGLKLYGKTKQKTTSGKNLLNIKTSTRTINGVTFTVNPDRTIVVNGTSTSFIELIISSEFVAEKDSKQILNGCPSGGSNTYRLVYCEWDGSWNQKIRKTDTGDGVALSHSEEAMYCQVRIEIQSGATVNNVVFKPMIRLASITDNTYEPFSGGIPGPNPNYPQELDSLGEMGNLFDKNAVTKDRAISDETGEEFAASGYYASDYIDVSESKDIYITTTNSAAQWGSFYDSDKKFISGFSGFNTTRKIPSNAKYIRVTVVADALDTFVINEGTTPLPWRPYTGQKEIESRVTGKNLASDLFSDYTIIGSYLANMINEQKQTVTVSITIRDNNIDASGCDFGMIENPMDVSDISTYEWLVYNGVLEKSININNFKNIFIYPNTEEAFNKIFSKYNIQIEFGSEPTQYEPYKQPHSLYTPVSSGLPGIPLGQTIPDKIKNSPAHMSGVYWDEEDQQYYISDTVDYESGKYVERILQRTLNGSENNWQASNSYFYNDAIDTDKIYTSLNPKFMASVGRVPFQTLDNGGCGLSFAYYWRLKFEDMKPTDNTIDELKAYLAENPIATAVIRKEPTTRDLTATEMSAYRALRTNKPTTVIFNDCKARMGVKYNVDLESRMDENAAEERHESDLAYSNSIVQNVSGEKILIQDSSKAPLQGLKMYGKTTQKTYTGKNLLENIYRSQVVNGITVTVNDDGTITLNGTSTSETDIAIRTYAARQLLKAGTYMLSGVSEELKSKCYLIGSAYSLSYTFTTLTDDRRYFTLETDDEMYLTLRIYNGATFLNDTIYPMIRLASITDDTYEPYTGGIPSPNPAYPQDLNSLGKANGQIESVIKGYQLFDASKLPTKSVGGATLINNGDGSFTISGAGTLTETFNVSYKIEHDEFIKLFRAGKVYFKLDSIMKPDFQFSIMNGSNEVLNIRLLDSKKVEGEILQSYLDDETSYGQITLYRSKGADIVAGTGKPMLYQDGDGTWEPYKQPQSLTTKLPNGLPGIEVTDPSLATYTDEDGIMWCADEIDYENGKYVQRVGTQIVTKDDIVAVDNTYMTVGAMSFVRVQSNAIYQTDTVLVSSDIAIGVSVDGRSDNVNIYRCYIDTANSIAIRYPASVGEKTLDEAREDLAGSTVQYILATPLIHDLTPEQMKAYKALRTNHPTTIITNDCDAYMDVKYNVDLEIKMEDDAAEERYESDLKYGGAIVQTIQGESLVATDSAKAPFLGMKLFGKTEQFTTTGKNLLNNAHKELLNNNIQYNLPNSKPPIKLQGGTTYTLTCFATVKPTCLYLINYDTNIRIQLSYTYSITYTPENDINVYIDAYWHDDIGGVPSYAELMLEVGSESTDFEPYTGGQPSPSPDYPQELKSAGQASGQIESKVYGKNFVENTAQNTTINGVTFTVNKDKSVTVNGTSTDSSIFVVGEVDLENFNDLIISGAPKSTSNCRVNVVVYSGANYLDEYNDYGDGALFSKSNHPTATKLLVRCYVTSGVTVSNVIFYPMIRKADITDDTYEPYKQPQSLITKTPNGLPGVKVTDASLATYTDQNGDKWCCDEVDLANGKYVQRIGRVDLGSLDWTITDKGFFRASLLNPKKYSTNEGTPLMCEAYLRGGSYRLYENLDDMVINVGGNYVGGREVYLRDNRFSNATDFKNAVKGVGLIYELETPIIRDLTKEELKAFKALRSNYPTTTIMNDANAHMEASYVVDTKTYIDKKFAELAARLSTQS